MSRTMTISSWLDSKVTVRCSVGSSWRPAKISAYMRATRVGRVARRPSRSGSSPIASRISRTAFSMRGRSIGVSMGGSSRRATGSGAAGPRGADAQRASTSAAWPGPARATGAAARSATGCASATVAPTRHRRARLDGHRDLGGLGLGLGDAGALVERSEDLGQVGVLEGLLLDQRLGEHVERGAVGGEDRPGPVVGACR